MIHLVEPEEIDTHWDVIKAASAGRLGPLIWAGEEQVRQALKDELLFCFAILEQQKDQPLRGFAICSISSDPLSDTKTLIVMCAYAVLDVDGETWADGLVELMKFAHGKGCSRVVGFTQLDEVVDLAQRLGVNADYRLLSINIGGE